MRFASSTVLLAVLAVLAVSTPVAAQEWAKARLAASSRHQEWVPVKNGDRTVQSYVVYPETKNRATAVIVIHEIFGMTEWVQGVADQLAEAGYIAIAPDLLSGMGPNGGRTDSIGADKVREAIGKLPPDQITADLNAVANYILKVPAANGKLAVAGFCWGGGQTFRFATNRGDVGSALVFYGPAPAKPEEVSRIQGKVFGFYGENDARINAGIPEAERLMKEAKKVYDPAIYKGAGHGFMRAGEAPKPEAADQLPAYEANKKAREDAWVRLKEILKKQ